MSDYEKVQAYYASLNARVVAETIAETELQAYVDTAE
jgi:hypothetical protein